MITNSSGSLVVMIVYPAFAVRPAVRASLTRKSASSPSSISLFLLQERYRAASGFNGKGLFASASEVFVHLGMGGI